MIWGESGVLSDEAGKKFLQKRWHLVKKDQSEAMSAVSVWGTSSRAPGGKGPGGRSGWLC